MSSSWRVKGGRTYRRQFPGEYVLVMLAVGPGPDNQEILIEGPVSKEFHDKLVKLYADYMTEQPRSAKDIAADSTKI